MLGSNTMDYNTLLCYSMSVQLANTELHFYGIIVAMVSCFAALHLHTSYSKNQVKQVTKNRQKEAFDYYTVNTNNHCQPPAPPLLQIREVFATNIDSSYTTPSRRKQGSNWWSENMPESTGWSDTVEWKGVNVGRKAAALCPSWWCLCWGCFCFTVCPIRPHHKQQVNPYITPPKWLWLMLIPPSEVT